MTSKLINYLKIICYLSIFLSAHAFANTTPLRVGVPDNFPPVSFIENGIPRGISVELWEEIAKTNHLTYTYVFLPSNMADNYNALIQNKLDVLLGPISITQQMIGKMQYSFPYFTQNISILAPTKSRHIHDLLTHAIEEYLTVISLIYFVLFLIYINIVWAIEHFSDKNQEPSSKPPVPKRYLSGLWYIFYHHISFSDHFFDIPKTNTSRILYLIYIYSTYAFLTILAATLTSILTTAAIDSNNTEVFNEDNIHQKKLAYPSNRTFYQNFVTERHLLAVPTQNINDAIQLLKNRKVDGVLNSQIILEDYLRSHQGGHLAISPFSMGYIFYYIGLSLKNPYINIINSSIIELQGNYVEKAICQKYDVSDPKFCTFY